MRWVYSRWGRRLFGSALVIAAAIHATALTLPRFSLAVFAALLAGSTIYRARLAAAGPIGTLGPPGPAQRVPSGLARDVPVVFALTCALFGLEKIAPPGLAYVLAQALLLLYAAVCQGQHSMYLAARAPLTAELLGESLHWTLLRGSLRWLLPSDIAILFAPTAVFWALLLVPSWLGGPVTTLAVATSGALAWLGSYRPGAPLANPASVLLTAIRPRRRRGVGGGLDAASHVWPGASASLTPVLAGCAGDSAGIKSLPPAAGMHAYNVILVVMESTGFDAAFTQLADSSRPMSFVHELGQRGYFLENHFATGNSTPNCLFSICSGLYPNPGPAFFALERGVRVPSLATFLGDRYERFIVSPGDTDWYFPRDYLERSGFAEIYGLGSLPEGDGFAPRPHPRTRDEHETVTFFLGRIDEAVRRGRPFLGVYCSFVAHYPYVRYGPPHVVPPGTPQNDYYNNLRYLDRQIERIYSHCARAGLLDRTILVLVGDHGEAFGQHEGNYIHSLGSYNENFKTPMILYHQGLFPPRRIHDFTSHVDLVPTLFDALGIAGDGRRLLQGESLYQEDFRRRYIYAYGNEGTLTSIDRAGIKLQVSLKDDSAWAYDLGSDPEERARRPWADHPEQMAALSDYRRDQEALLRGYNATFTANERPGPEPLVCVAIRADGAKRV